MVKKKKKRRLDIHTFLCVCLGHWQRNCNSSFKILIVFQEKYIILQNSIIYTYNTSSHYRRMFSIHVRNYLLCEKTEWATLTESKAGRWERQQIDPGNKLMALSKTEKEIKNILLLTLVTYVRALVSGQLGWLSLETELYNKLSPLFQLCGFCFVDFFFPRQQNQMPHSSLKPSNKIVCAWDMLWRHPQNRQQ